MKKFILIFAVLLVATGCNTKTTTTEATYPEPTGYVVDEARVLKPETVNTLNNELKNYDSKAQIAVVMIKTTSPLVIEDYSIKLAEKWKPGYKGKDNGVIFLVATDDRKDRIEVGRGLEGTLTDLQAQQILDNIVKPSFKNNNWDQGVLDGVHAIEKEIK